MAKKTNKTNHVLNLLSGADEQDADGKAENGDDVRKKRDVHSSGGSIKAERMNSTFF